MSALTVIQNKEGNLEVYGQKREKEDKDQDKIIDNLQVYIHLKYLKKNIRQVKEDINKR
jgi:hypothetical protein